MPPTPREPVPQLEGRAVLEQSWTRLTYLHWPYAPEVVAPFLPEGVEPDVRDGVTWVGLIPFAMRRTRVMGTPPLPYLADFLETNVRVYSVDREGRPGVVFLSLDADRALPVLAARLSYRLPYIWSAMRLEQRGNELTYTTRRRRTGTTSRIRVRVGGPVTADPLDEFLTARWALHSRWYGTTAHAPVVHPPWPLRSAELLELDDGLVAASGLPAPQGPPRVLHSDGVDVRIGRPRRLAQTRYVAATPAGTGADGG